MAGADSPTTSTWEKVQEVFAEALEVAEAERAAFVERASAGDDEVRAEVESLLAAAAESHGYFDDLAGRAGITLSDTESVDEEPPEPVDPRPDLIGTDVGQYRVLSWLGRGGMASVYLAERQGQGFTQRVALKLVLRQASDPSVLKRSSAERRILARLEHRGIARLIDGGVTEEGYPYYAMEYVEGADLLEYCDAKRLSVKERLQLFLEVCAPVQYAHERLVVHCDIKPNNIYVTDEGHVKLLDFGVARLVDPDADGDTVTGFWFTPAYASPEQVYREPPGTASDVYSLGVLLYEVLTGHRPYRFPSRSPLEVMRTVGELVPARPSTVVSRTTLDARDAAALDPALLASRRRSTPERMRKRLRGDLDAIVLKALAKNPHERYATAEQLAADIRRHLEHRPLSCLPRTRRYRMSKLLRRHRQGVALSAVLSFTVVAGVGTTLWQAARATEAAELAREEAEKASRVASLMTDMFRLSDPNEVLGDTITARDLLDRGAERIMAEFGDQPVIQAELLGEVATVYRNLGLFRRAEPLARRARDLRVAELGPDSPEAVESLVQLGIVEADLGRQSDAIATLSRAVEARRGLAPFPDSVLLAAQGRLAWLLRQEQRHDEAAALFEEGLEGYRALDPGGPGEADMTFGLASTYHESGMLDEADALLRSVLAELDPEMRPTPMALGALLNVGMIRRVREQFRDAEPILRSAYDMARTLYGPEHPEVFAAQNELGLTLWGTGEWEEAEALLRQALLASSSLLGSSHPSTAGLQEALGVVLMDREAYDEAAVLFQLSLEEKVARYEGRDHPGVVASYTRLVEALAAGGRSHEALAQAALAQEMMARLSADPSVYSISIERSLGRLAAAAGDDEAAEAHFRLAIERAEQLLSRPTHRYILWAKRDYGRFLASRGRTREARDLLAEVLAGHVEAWGEPHPAVDRVRAELSALER